MAAGSIRRSRFSKTPKAPVFTLFYVFATGDAALRDYPRGMLQRSFAPIVLTLLCLLGLSPNVAAKAKLQSAWIDREIVIDGEPEEWRDRLVYVASADTFVGLLNDDRYLYICLYSRSPQVAQELIAGGLRLRVESKSGGKRSVSYPKAGEQAGSSVDLRISGGETYSVDVGGTAGVEAASSFRGSFVYEIKLPLMREENWPWALETAPGEAIKLTFENPQVDTPPPVSADVDRRRGRPFGNPGADGLARPGADPQWDRTRMEQDFVASPFLYVLKARTKLAKKK